MAQYDQQATTYSDTTPHIRIISNIIQFIDPVDTPLIDALGGLDAARSKFKVGGNGYKIEILEDEYAPVSGTLNNGGVLATNGTQFTATDASMLQPGHVVQLDDEYVVVSSVNYSTEVVTMVARNYGGTNSTHDTSASFSIVGMARLEGDEADFVGLVDVTAPYNYTSIFQKGLKVSGSLQSLDQYGIDDHFAYQAAKAIPEKLREMELALFHGVRAAGSATTPRSFGGLGTFITDNTADAGGAIAKSDIDGVMESIFLDGGMPDLLVCHPSISNDIKGLLDTSSFVRFGNEVDQLGTAPVKRISTQFGDLRVLMSRWCPTSVAYVLDSSKAGLYTFRPFGWKRLGDVGDDKRGEVVGEFSFLVANDKAHGKITGITT